MRRREELHRVESGRLRESFWERQDESGDLRQRARQVEEVPLPPGHFLNNPIRFFIEGPFLLVGTYFLSFKSL